MKLKRIQIIGNIICLIPAAIICFLLFQNSLSANPIRTVTSITGQTAIYLLLDSLFCSPLHRILKMSVFIHLRKILGLYSFYYSFVHFFIFSAIDFELNPRWLIPEISQKPFLQIGLMALILLLLLAVTSINKIKISLGKWWKRIHYVVYLVTALIIIHITIASKGNYFKPLILAGIYLVAMVLRIPPINKLSIKRLPSWARELNTKLVN